MESFMETVDVMCLGWTSTEDGKIHQKFSILNFLTLKTDFKLIQKNMTLSRVLIFMAIANFLMFFVTVAK